MQFIVMHKVDSKMEAGEPPDQKIVQGMGALVQESLKSGTFLNGAGLHPSSRRTRLKKRGSEWSETKGPYIGENELVAAFVMVRAPSLPEAIAHAKRFADAAGDSEIEIGPVVEPWDLGFIPKPSDAPLRFLFLSKGDAAYERGEAKSQKRKAALAQLSQSLAPNGGVLASDTLAPSAKGARLAAPSGGKRGWIDGPFAESKELIAGFSILEVPSKADALAWADRYAAILGDNEVDVRELGGA